MRTVIWTIRLVAGALVATAAACEWGSLKPGDTIQLSEQQVSVIRDRLALVAPLHPDMNWASGDFAVSIGREMARITVTIGGTDISYYAVGLYRENVFSPASGFSTFHLLAFDDADDPHNFVIASGYAQQTGASLPGSVSGSVGGVEVSVHLVQQDGTITDWRATTGTVSFSTSATQGPCVGVTLPSIQTCRVSTLLVSFDVTTLRQQPQEPLSMRSGSLASVRIPAVTIRTENELP